MSSSRRTSGEIHILAMLDGKTAGPLSNRFLALPAAFWYGVAGVGVCILLAALAWLAHMPAPTPDPGIGAESTALRTAQAADAHEADPAPDPAHPADGNAVLVVTALPHADDLAPPPAGGATIVDVPPPAAPNVPAAAAATLATTPTTVTTAARPAPPAPAPAAHPAFTRTASAPGVHGHAVAPHGAGRTGLAARVASLVSSRSAHAAASKAPATRPTVPHRANAAHAAAVARTDTASPRNKRQPGTAKSAAPAAVDTDVALISAIIQHTTEHGDAPDAAASPCADRACGPRMPNRQ